MTLRDVQLFSLGILKDVHKFCTENDITYSLAYGTLLGAIRHRGFIPWDDDIDIIMPRGDYEKFCSSYRSSNYRIVSDRSSDCYIPFARVFDSEKTYVKMSNFKWCKFETGIWIDVFPVDGVSDDHAEFLRQANRSWRLLKLLYYNRTSFFNHIDRFHPFRDNMKLLCLKLLFLNGNRMHAIKERIVKISKKLPFGGTGHWSEVVLREKGMVDYQSIADFSSVELHDFEDAKFFVMNGYDRVLRNAYGDYLQLPPEEERIPKQHHVPFFWK